MTRFQKYKINSQTISEKHFNGNYEPTPEEIREYAVYIGIDPDKVNRKLQIIDLKMISFFIFL